MPKAFDLGLFIGLDMTSSSFCGLFQIGPLSTPTMHQILLSLHALHDHPVTSQCPTPTKKIRVPTYLFCPPPTHTQWPSIGTVHRHSSLVLSPYCTPIFHSQMLWSPQHLTSNALHAAASCTFHSLISFKKRTNFLLWATTSLDFF